MKWLKSGRGDYISDDGRFRIYRPVGTSCTWILEDAEDLSYLNGASTYKAVKAIVEQRVKKKKDSKT